jgi:hypothetical protein
LEANGLGFLAIVFPALRCNNFVKVYNFDKVISSAIGAKKAIVFCKITTSKTSLQSNPLSFIKR